MLKNYAGEKISPIMRKTTVEFASVASSILALFFLFGSTSGHVIQCLRLALGSLFEANRDLLSVANFFSCYSSHSAISSQAFAPQGEAE